MRRSSERGQCLLQHSRLLAKLPVATEKKLGALHQPFGWRGREWAVTCKCDHAAVAVAFLSTLGNFAPCWLGQPGELATICWFLLVAWHSANLLLVSVLLQFYQIGCNDILIGCKSCSIAQLSRPRPFPVPGLGLASASSVWEAFHAQPGLLTGSS